MEEPCCEDQDFIAHRESCARCAREWQQAREFEQMLQVAMSVQPENDLRAKQPLDRAARWRRQIWLKAVSVLLLVGAAVAGFNLAQQMFTGDDLPQLVVRHIQKEPEILNSRQAMNEMELLEALSPLGFELIEIPAEVTAAIPCWIRKRRGMHMVMRGGDGPVTVLLMPGEYAQQQQVVAALSLSGFLIPTGWGSMAVVSHTGEDIESLMHSLRRGMRWKGKQSSTASF